MEGKGNSLFKNVLSKDPGVNFLFLHYTCPLLPKTVPSLSCPTAGY